MVTFFSEIGSQIAAHWADVREFLNSQFSSSVIGSLAGAGFGAWGAQHIAERAKRREELVKEIRNTNTAMMLAFSICNSLLSMKKQHIRPLKDNFEKQRSAFLEHHEKRKLGQVAPGVLFLFGADFETFRSPEFPIGILQRETFEKLSLVGRPLNLVITLTQTLQSMRESCEKRNQLIESFRASAHPPDILAALYFGLPLKDSIDKNYADSVDAIYSQTDDAIFFSHLLIGDLKMHGQEVSAVFKRAFKKDVPKISDANFEKAEKAGLLPDAAQYADWNSMFVKNAKPISFRQKLVGWLKQQITGVTELSFRGSSDTMQTVQTGRQK